MSCVGLHCFHIFCAGVFMATLVPGVGSALEVEADISKDDPKLTEKAHQSFVGSPMQPVSPATGRKIGVKVPVASGGQTKAGYFNERTVAQMPGGVQFTVVVNGMSFVQG